LRTAKQEAIQKNTGCKSGLLIVALSDLFSAFLTECGKQMNNRDFCKDRDTNKESLRTIRLKPKLEKKVNNEEI
jgi:hypothetical protein